MDLARKFGVALCGRHFSGKCSVVQDLANPIGMGGYMTKAPLADKRKLEISDSTSSQALGCTCSRIDNEPAGVMHGVITFQGIAGNVINTLNNERFAKFARKVGEKIVLMIENGLVRSRIHQAAINAATFRSHLVKNSCC
jgi:hypothetical protein